MRRESRKELIGQRFGRLLVVDDAPRRGKNYFLKCLCDCGQEKEIGHRHLKTGNTRSCGCINRENPPRYMHGKSKSRAYNIWHGMVNRCTVPHDPGYEDYGGRGITVCARWMSFEDFCADMGEPPDGHEIDRINNDGNYELGNCRWVTRRTQARNKRSNVVVSFSGKTQCVADWAIELGIPSARIAYRIRIGWPVEKALTVPAKGVTRWNKKQICG